MEPSHPFTAPLNDPRVKDYFLRLVRGSGSPEEKYHRFAAFCAELSLILQPELQPAPPAGELAMPDLADLLPRLAESISRAALRMKASQHKDGGWGFHVEQSDLWGTVFALRFLHSLYDLPGVQLATAPDEMIAQGVAFLEQHPELWAAESIPPAGGMSVYDISLMARGFYRLGRSFMRRESAQRVYRSLGRLYRSQNQDGGWDCNIWGYEASTPVRVWSEAGATASAVLALVQTHDIRFQGVIEKSLLWLASTQNSRGSWNDGSCRPGWPAYQVSGQPSVNKTCDAVQAFLAAEALDLPLQPYRGCVERAAGWLLICDQERRTRQIQAAAWGLGYTRADYENACLVLETLSLYPDPDLLNLQPVLACAAGWLVALQRRQEGDAEDGSWVMGHTARIALALGSYYRMVKTGVSRQPIPWIP
jgi:hypothetical protein